MSKRKKKRFYQRPLGVAILIVIVVIVALGVSLIGRLIALSGEAAIEPAAAGTVIFAIPPESLGESLDFFTWIRNGGSTPVTIRSVTVDNGSPAQVSISHLALVTLADAECCEYGNDSQWPPAVRQGHAYTLHPVSGYILAPQTDVGIVFSAQANAAGTFVTGPVTVQGFMSAIPGFSGIGRTVTYTAYTYGILCYAGRAACNQQMQSTGQSIGG